MASFTQQYDWKYFSDDPKVIEQQLRNDEGIERGKFKPRADHIDLSYVLMIITMGLAVAVIGGASTLIFNLWGGVGSPWHLLILGFGLPIPVILFFVGLYGAVLEIRKAKHKYHTRLEYAKYNGWR